MATGDIVSVAVGADGWWADITVEGLSTGGTYALGLGTNNKPTAPKLALTVVSLGFDDTGTATTVTRTIYGTKEVRQPYPNAGLNQETAAGGNVTVRVALSDYVYAKDNTGAGNSGTAVTATLLSGLYTQAATPSNAASGVAVTNNSTAAYPKVVGNWAWPGQDKITAASFTLRAVAFHASGRAGRPVRCVKFTAADTHSNTATTTVTAPTVDATVGDAVPIVEYVASMSATTLTALDTITCNFIAYPWIGDAAACLDTTAGTAQPTPLYGPITLLNDKSDTYGKSYASVDPVSGNDTTGTVTSASVPTLPFLTMSAAYNALRTYNNTNYARNNCGGSVMYLRTGSHAWLGGTPTIGTVPATWLTITRHPSDAKSGVIIASQSGGKSGGVKCKVVDVSITAQSATGVMAAGNGTTAWLWIDQCTVNCPVTTQPPFYSYMVQYFTRNNFVAHGEGFQPYGDINAASAIIRGNTMATVNRTTYPYVFIGNKRLQTTALPASGGGEIQDVTTGVTVAPAPANTVIAFNQLSVSLGTLSFIQMARSTKTHTHGMAIVQNLLEQIGNSGSPMMQIAADSSTGNPVNNVILWNNTVVGQRTNLGYNEVDPAAGGGLATRWGWSMKNNIWDEPNTKSDTFAGSGFVADATKVGNWSFLYGAGCSGNLHAETVVTTAGWTFMWEMPGLSCDQPPATAGSQPPTATAGRAVTYPQFVNRQAYDGTTAGAGSGDYRVATTSPAMGLPIDWVLPYDIAGNPRSLADPAGTYIGVSNPVLNAAGFFA